MKTNPILKGLGLSDNDRAVIFHADDIGMCQATLDAYTDLISFGLLSSAAVMVPCPWFPAVARFCRANGDQRQGDGTGKPIDVGPIDMDRIDMGPIDMDPIDMGPIDMGVHLTLTSEWDDYRWGPIATSDTSTGLIDGEGYFFRDPEPVQEHAKLPAVQLELMNQIERAFIAGIDVTHIDSHMGALFHPRLITLYLELTEAYQLPAFMLRPEALERLSEEFVTTDLYEPLLELSSVLEARGFPMLDALEMMSLDESENRLEEATERLDRLPAGISYFIIHPAKDTPELGAIAPDWPCRVADYELFMSDEWRQVVERSGVKVIGWRELRDQMRST